MAQVKTPIPPGSDGAAEPLDLAGEQGRKILGFQDRPVSVDQCSQIVLEPIFGALAGQQGHRIDQRSRGAPLLISCRQWLLRVLGVMVLRRWPSARDPLV